MLYYLASKSNAIRIYHYHCAIWTDCLSWWVLLYCTIDPHIMFILLWGIRNVRNGQYSRSYFHNYVYLSLLRGHSYSKADEFREGISFLAKLKRWKRHLIFNDGIIYSLNISKDWCIQRVMQFCFGFCVPFSLN